MVYRTRKFFSLSAILILFIILLLVIIGINPTILVFPEKVQENEENISIALGNRQFSTLSLVAENKGFFHRYGLNVTFREYPSGVEALKEVISGDADLAYAAEFVGVSHIFQYPGIRILGSTARSNVISLIARRENSSEPRQLKGKNIGVPKGTQAEFFLSRYLMLNSMKITDVSLQYLSPPDLESSMVSGKVDAIIVWEPYVSNILMRMGDNVTSWNAQGGQDFYWVIYTRDDYIRTKSALLYKYLHALSDAENYMLFHKEESREVIRQEMKASDAIVGNILENNHFVLSLDQSLIIAMEGEARWMIKNNLTNVTMVPNYLDYLSPEYLQEVCPNSMNII